MLIYDTGMQNGGEAAWRIQNVENCRKSQIYVKLKNMQIKMINNNNILMTWYRNFALPTCVHYNHCVCLSFQFAFRTFLLRPDTD